MTVALQKIVLWKKLKVLSNKMINKSEIKLHTWVTAKALQVNQFKLQLKTACKEL